VSFSADIGAAMKRPGLLFAGVLVLLVTACATPPNEASSSGAVDTGTFPNLNVAPGEANSQFTPQDVSAKKAELAAAARANNAQATPPPNDILLLRKLGKSHVQDALKEIEGK